MTRNETIAKNTLFLYVRMILTLGVSLYTSRVVLNTLGIEDFGIYNLVGGIVVLFSFINGAMTSATQRFLNFEMGKGDSLSVNKVFCVSMNAYFLVCGIVIFFAETIGLWFLNNKLNIPLDRMYAANIVYQFSIITFIVNIIKIPYNASIIAYEKMSFFAWASLLEVGLKLAIVFLLLYFAFDKLILYSILTFIVSVLIFLIYRIYCLRTFDTCKFSYLKDEKLFKELLTFSGWSMFGNVAVISSSQGISMMMNIFFGVTINAAMGIANQVNTALYGFVSSFQKAFNPQIVKTYASDNIIAHKKLLYQASKFSYFLLLLLAIPVLFNTEYILLLWLKILPPYSVVFTQLTIIVSLFEALSGPFWMSTSASGKIRVYQIVISGIIFLNLPLSYIILSKGYPPSYVFVVKLMISILMYIFRLLYVKNSLDLSLSEIFTTIISKVIIVTVSIWLTMLVLKNYLLPEVNSIFNLVVFISSSILLSSIFIFLLGVSKNEKSLIISLLSSKIKNKK